MNTRIKLRRLAVPALAVLLCACTLAEPRPTPISRPEITVKKEMSIQNVEAPRPSLSKSGTAAALQAQTFHEYSVPPDWPRNRSWRPIRHFGPFFSGSIFDKVKVHVARKDVITMVYNDFLTGHEDAEIFPAFTYGCANLTALAQQAAYGVVSETTVEGMELLRMETNEPEGWFSFTTRVVLPRM